MQSLRFIAVSAFLSLTLQACTEAATDGDSQCDQAAFYGDRDGDGLGDPAHPVDVPDPCNPLKGAVANAEDAEPHCATNDTDACGVCGGGGPRSFYVDANMNGFADVPVVEVKACNRKPGLVEPPKMPPDGCEFREDAPGCVPNATCKADCTAHRCGDDLHSVEAGEECDAREIPFGNCHACKRVDGFRMTLPTTWPFGDVCITKAKEIYVASADTLSKVNSVGELEWQLVLDFGSVTAGLGCDATYGVAAVRYDENITVRRWRPDGSAAFEPVQVASGSASAVVMRDDGSVVFVRPSECSGYSCSGVGVIGEDGTVIATGTAPNWLTRGSVVDVTADSWARLLVDAGKLTVQLLTGELHDESEPLSYEVALQGGEYLLARYVGDGAMAFTQRKSGERLWIEGYSFGGSGIQNWTKPVTLARGGQEKLDMFTPWGADRALVASRVDGVLNLTSVDRSGRIAKTFDTGFRLDQYSGLLALGDMQDGNVLLVQGGAKLVLTLIAFESRAQSVPLAADGASCQGHAECASAYCASSRCQTTTASVGAACSSDANCESGLCANKLCVASQLTTGMPCVEARQCISKLCTASGCG